MSITLRPVDSNDDEFLFEVYASTRREEISAWGLDSTQQDAFLKMQFAAQRQSFETKDANRSHDIILLDDKPIGRLLVARSKEEIHLVDIALLNEFRGRQIGTTLIRNLFDESDENGKPVRLEVLKGNPAAMLYERLGFVKTGARGMHVQMERLAVLES